MLGDSTLGYNYETWKWRSLQQRRVFIFPIISLFLFIIWGFIITHVSRHCENTNGNKPCDKPNVFFLSGLSAFFLTFHFLFLVATLFTKWGVELLSNDTMGMRLCIITEISWSTLIYLMAKGVLYWIVSNFERGLAYAALQTIGLTLFHHTGLTQIQLFWIPLGAIISWIELKKYNSGTLGYFWICSFFFSIFNVMMQEAEYKRYYEFLKNCAVQRKTSLGDEEYRDVISTVEAVVGMISKLEYDVRDRIKKSLMTGQRKRNIVHDMNNSENLVKRHHPGSVDQIETLCNAITISLLSDASDVLTLPLSSINQKDDSTKRLSKICGLLFRTFEDSVSPRMVPLFYDHNAGDVEFLDISPKLFHTILFLILFDAVGSNSPGFCNVSFELPDSLQSLRLVITKVMVNTGSEKKVWKVSHKKNDNGDNNSNDRSLIKQLLPVQKIGNGNVPQVWLADRLVRNHLCSRIIAYGPEVKAGLSTFTWKIDLSHRTSKSIKNDVDVYDTLGNSYTWKIFEKLDEKKVSTDLRSTKYYTKFKSELNSLKVNYIVSQTNTKDSNTRRSKVGVIHENILQTLEECDIDYILLSVVDLIVLADGEVKQREVSSFFSKNKVMELSKKEWPTEFRKALRMYVSADITAAEFFEAFKHTRKSNRLEVISKNRIILDNRVIYPAFSTKKKNENRDEFSGLILKSSGAEQLSNALNGQYLNERALQESPLISNEPLTYSQVWRNAITEWLSEAHGYPRFLSILNITSSSNTPTPENSRPLPPHQKKIVNFIDGVTKTLELSACISFEVLNKIKSHAMIRESENDPINNRSLYIYLVQYYAKPLGTLQALIEIFTEFIGILNHGPNDPETRQLLKDIRISLQYLIERTAYDDLDFLNLWFQAIQAMISEEFSDYLELILVDVVPNMLNIGENAIWGIPELMESSYLNL